MTVATGPIAALVPVAAFTGILFAQASEKAEQDFSADRPGFATSPSVLRRGLSQLEGGVTFAVARDGDRKERTLTLGSPLLRIGVGQSVELRVGGDGLLARGADSGRGGFAAGWSDLALGAKVSVVEEGSVLPAISLLPSISVPAGNSAFTSSTFDPSIAVLWLKTLGAGLNVGGTLTGTRVSDSGVRRVQYASAISVGIPAPARFAGYVEIYALTTGARRTSTWISDAGLSRNLGPNLQIDIEAGRQVSPRGSSWFVAMGFALRHSSPFRR